MCDMPEIPRCCGMFSPKYGSYLISYLGLATGGFGVASIILYGLVEKSFMAEFVNSVDPGVRKAMIMTLGITSLLLLVGSVMLFFGVPGNSQGLIAAGKWVLLITVFILLFICIGAPLSCFFMDNACVIKKISTATTVLLFLMLWAFISFWVYFAVVVNNFQQEL